MSIRPLVLLLAAAGLLVLSGASSCRGKEHTYVAPSAEEMEEQRRDEAQQEIERDLGEAARDDALGEEVEP